jgi:hypothetical protein
VDKVPAIMTTIWEAQGVLMALDMDADKGFKCG